MNNQFGFNENQPIQYPTNITPITDAIVGDYYGGGTHANAYNPNAPLQYDYGAGSYADVSGVQLPQNRFLENTRVGATTDLRNLAMSKVGQSVGAMSFGDKVTAGGGIAKGLFDAYNAYKTNKLANKQFEFTKMNTNRNFQASANVTNSRLEDRQKARYARDSTAHASVSDYMGKYGVKV